MTARAHTLAVFGYIPRGIANIINFSSQGEFRITKDPKFSTDHQFLAVLVTPERSYSGRAGTAEDALLMLELALPLQQAA